jgi:hypothetical protein
MKSYRWLWLAALLAIATLSLAAPRPAHAETTVEHVVIEGEGVAAEWAYTDESGAATVVSVVASEYRGHPSTAVPTPFLNVSILRFDAEGFPVVLALGETQTFVMDLHQNLQTAHLSATVLVTDGVTGTENEPVEIDLTFEAVGPVVKFNDSSQTNENGVKVITVFHSKSVEGEATGEVILFGENFAPMPSTSASANQWREITTTITHD